MATEDIQNHKLSFHESLSGKGIGALWPEQEPIAGKSDAGGCITTAVIEW